MKTQRFVRAFNRNAELYCNAYERHIDANKKKRTKYFLMRMNEAARSNRELDAEYYDTLQVSEPEKYERLKEELVKLQSYLKQINNEKNNQGKAGRNCNTVATGGTHTRDTVANGYYQGGGHRTVGETYGPSGTVGKR